MMPIPSSSTHAPGLQGNWLNGWLAALGITILVDHALLSWSDDPVPHAIVTSPVGESLAARIAAALPTTTDLGSLAIARNRPDAPALPRKVTQPAYAGRVPTARAAGDFSLAATVTDLADAGPDGYLRHAPLDPAVPKGLTLWDRLVDCRKALPDDPTPWIDAALAGHGRRVKVNGLGFDYTRLQHAASPTGGTWSDPALECLAFMGLAFLPIRGDGHRTAARGWTQPPSRPGAFTWPVWRPPLPSIGIDGLLDRWWNGLPTSEVITAFRSVPYRKLGDADTTVGYASEQVTSQRDATRNRSTSRSSSTPATTPARAP
jgi:hypothetical protein